MEEHLDLKRYERLIFKHSHQTMRRLLAAGAKSVTLEDVAQEYRIAWFAASRNYDPGRGVPWMPYLINGLRQVAHEIVRKYTFKLQEERFALSIWDAKEGDEGAMNGALESTIAGPTVDPVDEIYRKEMLPAILEKLSPRARIFVRLLSDPPEEIYAGVLHMRAKAKHAQQMGLRTAITMTVTASMIFDLMDAGRRERLQIIRELKALGEKNCRTK